MRGYESLFFLKEKMNFELNIYHEKKKKGGKASGDGTVAEMTKTSLKMQSPRGE